MLSVRILVALCESEVNDKDLILSSVGSADEEVVWLDIPVDNPFLVNLLNELNHLNRNQEDCLEREFALAHLEKVLKRRSKHVHYHNMVVLAIRSLFITDVMQIGYIGLASKLMNQFAFPE
jgi:hypothetical protein